MGQIYGLVNEGCIDDVADENLTSTFKSLMLRVESRQLGPGSGVGRFESGYHGRRRP